MKSLQDIYLNYQYHPEAMGCGDKGTTHSYIEYYQQLLEPYREVATDILEIGVAPGALSLRMWEEYFFNASIYGIDIQEYYDNITKYNNDRIKIDIGNATKKEDIDRLYLYNTFDFILDDGSHSLRDQLMSFEYLFPKVNPGGIYIIEDIQEYYEPAIADIFRNLHPNVDIVDRRHIKGRYDDIIITIRKDK